MDVKTFYRVGNIKTLQGLWYDKRGEFTGLIHRYPSCKSSKLPMPYDDEITGFLSATQTIAELKEWFPVCDMAELYKFGYVVLKYNASNYKKYKNHWLINQKTSLISEIVPIDSY